MQYEGFLKQIMNRSSYVDVKFDVSVNCFVWLEKRISGYVLVKCNLGGKPCDLLTDWKIGGNVNYGGGDFCVGDGYVIFCSQGDLYRYSIMLSARQEPVRLTQNMGCCAAPEMSKDGLWVVFIRQYANEDYVMVVDVVGKNTPAVLFSGHDFYMQPTWHPKGHGLAVVAWNKPNMPWDASLLYVLDVEIVDGLPALKKSTLLVAGDDFSVFQPSFSADGKCLAYISDQSGWSQLYVCIDGMHKQLMMDKLECGRPAWLQGMCSYAWLHNSYDLCVMVNHNGEISLIKYNLIGDCAQITSVSEFSYFANIASVGDLVVSVGSSVNTPPEIVVIDPINNKLCMRYADKYDVNIPKARVQAVQWLSSGQVVHGLFSLPEDKYIDKKKIYPLIVIVHGGPTSQRFLEFDLQVQYFNACGYGVLQVNYRGSSGYGREYMLAGRGRWADVDVDDVISGVEYICAKGLVDPKRVVLLGGSAGATIVLHALLRCPAYFLAGICSYPVADLCGLENGEFKFEAHYNQNLIGDPIAQADVYKKRSILPMANKIGLPVLLFHGADDVVVSKSQSDKLADSLPNCKYHVFSGEGHGWKQVSTKMSYYKFVTEFLSIQFDSL